MLTVKEVTEHSVIRIHKAVVIIRELHSKTKLGFKNSFVQRLRNIINYAIRTFACKGLNRFVRDKPRRRPLDGVTGKKALFEGGVVTLLTNELE